MTATAGGTTSDPSDAELAERASAGDERAFTALVKRHEGPVFALCARYLGNADAADAAQETFVRAFVHASAGADGGGIKRFDRTRPMLPWLFTIARRICIDVLRARKHDPGAPGGDDLFALDARVEPDVVARAELRHLGRAFAQLAEGPREALALFHFHDLSYKEIAEQLEIPMGTVMTWIHRGRDALRQAVSEPAQAAVRDRRSAP